MKFIENWYTNYEVAKIYASHRDKRLANLSSNLSRKLSKPIFLEYIYNSTKNYLPVNSYSSFMISNKNSFGDLDEIIRDLEFQKVTSAFLPIISEINPEQIISNKYKNIYLKRLNSYFINLNNDLNTLKKNISKRKRSDINIQKFSGDFHIATPLEREKFFSMYSKFMYSRELYTSNIFKKELIEKLLSLKNNILFVITIDKKIELMHFIGIDNNVAEFVLSASTKKGYSLGYTMIWNELCFLKDMGIKRFHLGGGIYNNDDGVSTFKKRIGGEILYNGGLKLVLDIDLYQKESNQIKFSENKSFFPIYLKDQIFSNKK